MTDSTDVALQVRDLFDAKAAGWPSKYAQGGRLAGRLSMLANMVSCHAPTGGRVLDLGCGTGDLARHLSAVGFQVTGCDVSASMLTTAATIGPADAVNWVQLSAHWQVLPFSDGAFDAVVASSVLEYVGSPAVVLAECARVMRPGAVVLATVPDLAHPVRWLEGLVYPVAFLPYLGGVVGEWPRLSNYLAYLRISRQRHRATWWARAASRAGLVTLPSVPTRHAPLRLLTFHSPAPDARGALQRQPESGHPC